MMAASSLPQAQSGLAAILAALGSAPATTRAETGGGFEQLFANLPAGAATAGAAADVPASATPAPATPGSEATLTAALAAPAIAPILSSAGPASVAVTDLEATDTAPVPETAGTLPASAAKAAEPAQDPAIAASLLIAASSPQVGAPSGRAKPVAPATGEKPEGEGDQNASQGGTGETPMTDQPAAAAPLAAAIVASAEPDTGDAAPVKAARASTLPDAAKPAKSAATAATEKLPQAAAKADPAPAIRTSEAVSFVAPAKPVAETTPAKAAVDLGASMTVLFGQPAAHGASAADIAKAAVPVAERTLDMASDDQWIAQLASDIAATKSETGDLSFRLMPRHLGRLDVAMKMDDGGSVSLKLDAQHEATATIVTAAQPRLVEDLRQQGVRVADAQVTHTPAETGRQQQQQGQGGRNAAPNTSHLIETANERVSADRNERTADRRGRFA